MDMVPETSIQLQQTQSQKQIFSTAQVQSLQILQCPMPELLDYLREAALENPFLSFLEEPFSGPPSVPEEYEDDNYVSASSNSAAGDKMGWMMNLPQPQDTLRDYLTEQLFFMKLSKEENAMVKWLIAGIGDNGYLQISAEQEGSFDPDLYSRALHALWSMDPPGIGARTAQECLLLQAKRIPLEDDVISVIAYHLDDLAAGSLRKISADMHLSAERICEIRRQIAGLNPFPGNGFTASESSYVYPEIIVKYSNGRYYPFQNRNDPAKLEFDHHYFAEVSQSPEKEVRKYLTEKRKEAETLWQSVCQRRETIFNIASVIVENQTDFLENGAAHLHPMTMEAVAEVLGVHPSTVSRACQGKYMQTPRGVYPFKFFFSAAVPGNDGTGSANGVKAVIQELVRKETPSAPYSDQKLSELLKERGLSVARRTVAKYRGQLNIPDAAARRR